MKKILKKACCIMLAFAVILTVPMAGFASTGNPNSQAITMEAMASKLKKPIITVEAVSNNYLKVSWKKCSGASKYSVYRKVAGGKYKRVITTSKLYYKDYKVRYNVKYHYKVKAVGKNGKTSSYSSVKYSKTKLNKDCYYGLYGVPDFGKFFGIDYEDYYIEEYETGFIYRGGEIINAGYSANEVIDLYSDLLKEYGFDYKGTSLVNDTMIYYFARNYLESTVCIEYDSYGITITIEQ